MPDDLINVACDANVFKAAHVVRSYSLHLERDDLVRVALEFQPLSIRARSRHLLPVP